MDSKANTTDHAEITKMTKELINRRLCEPGLENAIRNSLYIAFGFGYRRGIEHMEQDIRELLDSKEGDPEE